MTMKKGKLIFIIYGFRGRERDREREKGMKEEGRRRREGGGCSGCTLIMHFNPVEMAG